MERGVKMEKVQEQLLIDLTSANGIAGHEKEVREVFKAYTRDSVEKFVSDGLGGIFGVKTGNPNGPKIMFAGHMDEVGFMVTQITEKGFVKFQTIGGWWNQVMLAQQVTITTHDGHKIDGVIGSKPSHILSVEDRKKPVEVTDMFIDIAASSKEEAESWGIRPGDMVTPSIEFKRLNGTKYLMAKAWDNRVGTAVAAQLLKELDSINHENIVFSGANVQEEIGLRGAKVSSNVIQPDISFALDTGIPGDTPGIAPHQADSILGKGPQIVIYDASMVPHRGLRDFVIDLAEELDIPFQYAAIAGGGTDAGSQHVSGKGVPSLAICIPIRYLHTHATIMHEDDFHATLRLVKALAERLTWEAVEKIKENA